MTVADCNTLHVYYIFKILTSLNMAFTGEACLGFNVSCFGEK